MSRLHKKLDSPEAGIEEVALHAEDVERDAVNQEAITQALSNFNEVFDCIPPYQQKELMRLVLHKAVVSHNHMELALYGKPPELSHMTQGAARSQTSDWLPGLVSQSVILWDRVCLEWTRIAKGRLTVRLLGAA